MNHKKSLLILLALWAGLTVFAWFGPKQEISQSERRPLAQFPEVSVKNLLSGKFMADFEDYSLDQFPLRDGFRNVKSEFHLFFLRQSDNNGIYVTNGHAVQQEYPLNQASLDHAMDRFTHVWEKYLQNNRCFFAIVPDKGYYLAEDAGQPRMDYDALFRAFQQEIPWATHIDLTDVLSAGDYYRTDTHWRQERLLPAAEKICRAMDISLGEFFPEEQEVPFYGVYYGQSALSMAPDTITLMENEWIRGCTVYDYESGKTRSIYDLEKLTGKDPYEVYLSGPRSLLEITNPSGEEDRHLVVFRDSFGSAMAPLLAADYGKITLIDIRYLQADLLGKYVDFTGADVLFLYSTLVLNNSETIK